MSKVLFSFSLLVFFTWLFQYLNFSFLNPIQIPFLKEYKFEWIISTQYMFTTLWATFAFWYWYKRYERDKEIDTIRYFSKKYDSIKNSFNDWKINEKKYYSKIWNLWLEEFVHHKRWYITDQYFEEITGDIYVFIRKEIPKKNGFKILLHTPLGFDIWFNTFIIGIIEDLINHLKKIQKWAHKKYKSVLDKNINELEERKNNFIIDPVKYSIENLKN